MILDTWIDRQVNLSEVVKNAGKNFRKVVRLLQLFGFTYHESHQFAMFALFGFHGPTEKQTLCNRYKRRITLPPRDHPKTGKETVR